jgi:tyramine---L-glutamate ligase
VRILVHEFVSGGGLAGRDVPASLAREGAAMLEALVADLAVVPGHEVVVTTDSRFSPRLPGGVEVVRMDEAEDGLGRRIRDVDAVWPIAPETGGCLERLVAGVEAQGKRILGSGADAIRRASDKAALPGLLAETGVPHPPTCVLERRTSLARWQGAASRVGYPVVVKPARGAGCEGVCLVDRAAGLEDAVATAVEGPLLLQRWVTGVAASVALLADGVRAMPLAVSAQQVRTDGAFRYEGGETPLEHPMASRGAGVAVKVVEAVGDLRGYVGVDLILTDSDALVIEINPRLTTSYIGIRAAFDRNVAELAIAACGGRLPPPMRPPRSVSFDSAGRVLRTSAHAVR